MSFGMKNLISSAKVVSGWYYVLRDDVGRTKHLKASKEQKALARSRGRGKSLKRKREEGDTGDRSSSVLCLDASIATQPDLRTSGRVGYKLVDYPSGLPEQSHGVGRVDGGSHTRWPIKRAQPVLGNEKLSNAAAKQKFETFPSKPSSEVFSGIQARGGKENGSTVGVSIRPEPPADAKEVDVAGEKQNWLRKPLHFLPGSNLPEGKHTLGSKRETLIAEAPNNSKKVGSAGGKRALENCQPGAFHTFPGSRPAEAKVGQNLGQGFARCPPASTSTFVRCPTASSGTAVQRKPVSEDYLHQGSSKDILGSSEEAEEWKGSRGGFKRRSPQGTSEEGQSSETDSAYMDRPDPLLSWITLHYVVLCKDASGKYGFTLLDTLPVQVGSVEKGSQAEAAGLQKGDYFLEIGGYNVAGINSRGIKDILKQTHSKIDALVQRHSDPTTRPSIPVRPSKLRRKHQSEKEEEARKNLHNNRLRSVKASAARAAALTRKKGLLLMGYSGNTGNLSPVSLVQKRLKRELIATVAMRRKRMLPEKEGQGGIILERESKDGDFLGERKGPDGRWSSSTDAMTSDSGGDEIIPRRDTGPSPDAQVNADVALVSGPYRESVRDSGRLSVRDLILEPLKQSPQTSPQDSFRESLKDAVRAQALRNSFQEAAKELSATHQGSPKETASAKNPLQDLPSVPQRNSVQETARTASQSSRNSTVYENAWIMMPRKNTKSENQIYEKATCSCSSCPQTPPRSPMRKLSEEFNRQIIVQPKLPTRHSPDGEASMLLSELKDSPYELPVLLPQEKQLAKSSTALSDFDVAVSRPLKPSLSERQLARPPIVMERKRSLPQLTKSGSSDLALHQSAMTISELHTGEDVQEPANAARRLAKVTPVMRKTSRSKSEDYLGATLLPHISDPDLYANNHILKKGKSQSFAALSRSLRREGNAKPPVPSRVYVNEKIGRATRRDAGGRDAGASSINASMADHHGDEDVDDSAVKMRCSFAQYGKMEEVLFTKGIEPFTLGPPDRELIHAGRLFFFNKRKKFREVLAMVFNDALVIARSQHQDGRLRVIFPRLLILDISLLNFNCENAREFSITPVLSSSGHEAACHHGSIIFRAPSVKLKRSWQRVLTQQVMAVKYTSLGKVG
ncbi:uncharacterized protein [Diadema antillarum]|uniref:uncharacterized protein isoform X2 n=1 Tax=Diadema antillarum TaxID=105358 RepID=UPI003A872598